MKRIFLFLVTNLIVTFTLVIAANLVFLWFGTTIENVFGPEWSYCIVFSFVFGMGGAFISLLLSKTVAKFSCNAKTITGTEGEEERWLVETVADLARRAGIRTPEVAVYSGAPNAFATGAFKNSALVAVSNQLCGQMTREELRAVLGHEISHVASGDMVTLGLIQGILNSFVILFSRIFATIVENALNGRSNERHRNHNGFIYFCCFQLFQLVFGLLASLIAFWFSRRREFAADAGSADLLGSPGPMIAALRRLEHLNSGILPDSIKAFGISSGKKASSIWSTHPLIEERIEALQKRMYSL